MCVFVFVGFWLRCRASIRGSAETAVGGHLVNCRHKHELTLIKLIQEPPNQAPMRLRLMEMLNRILSHPTLTFRLYAFFQFVSGCVQRHVTTPAPVHDVFWGPDHVINPRTDFCFPSSLHQPLPPVGRGCFGSTLLFQWVSFCDTKDWCTPAEFEASLHVFSDVCIPPSVGHCGAVP